MIEFFREGFYGILIIPLIICLVPIMIFVSQRKCFGQKILDIKTKNIPWVYIYFFIFYTTGLITDLFKKKPMDYITLDISTVILIVIFMMISKSFIKLELRENGVCSILGCWEWEKILSYSFDKAKSQLNLKFKNSIRRKKKEKVISWKISIFEKEKLENVMIDKKIQKEHAIHGC
jgi:hypothetical protein